MTTKLAFRRKFGYIFEYSIILWQDGKDDIIGKKGDGVNGLWKQIHKAIPTEKEVTVLVFCVHELGTPGRTIVKCQANGPDWKAAGRGAMLESLLL